MELRTCPECGASFKAYPSEIARGWDKYCSFVCFNEARKKRPPEERFWPRVDTSGGPDACWPWMGSVSHNGYGRFWLNGRNVPAQRFAWECVNGPMPDGMLGLHTCDNPPCCNPKHVFPGTNLDNMTDRDAKGRQASGDRSGMRTHPEKRTRGDIHWTRSRPDLHAKYIAGDNNPSHRRPESRPRGEKHYAAKLTQAQVDEMRELKAMGQWTNVALAARYGVSAVLIGLIVRNLAWVNQQ